MKNSPKKSFMKLAWRHNLIYPSLISLWILLRRLVTLLLDKFFNFSKNLLFTLLMFIGELSAGLIIYFYQKKFMRKKQSNENANDFLIYNEEEFKIPDSTYKIIFLIFISGYFDFIEFILSTNYVPKFINSSNSLSLRLESIMTIISSILFYYLLKLPILKHQFLSICVIAFCSIIIIILEYFFQDIDIFINYWDLSLKIILIIIEQFFNASFDIIEKYVADHNNLSYFKVLAIEGFFGSCITIIYSFFDSSYIIQIKEIYNEKSGAMFALFIFLLIIYIVFCGLKNAYRVMTNKIYSPMTLALADYFLNPLFLIVNYFEGDFFIDGKQNIFYFIISFILGIITDFFGCVFNEIIVLFFCGLEVDTHNQISFRSSLNYKKELSELKGDIEDEDE